MLPTVVFAAIGLTGAVFATAVPIDAQGAPRPPLVAAAASARFALIDLANLFERQTTQRVRLAFGSSGNLARQIHAGAPFELYLAADPRYVEALARARLTRGPGKDYLLGRLAIVVSKGSPLAADGSLEDLRTALAGRRVTRFAIANPEHAPYGERAEQALRHVGLWEAIQDRLVVGENVGQAAQFAVSGNADGSIIGLALARSPPIASQTSAAKIPRSWHEPLRHRAVLLSTAGQVATQFYDYLDSQAARDVFRNHGFDLPNALD